VLDDFIGTKRNESRSTEGMGWHKNGKIQEAI
jgi:hypothetical protein